MESVVSPVVTSFLAQVHVVPSWTITWSVRKTKTKSAGWRWPLLTTIPAVWVNSESVNTGPWYSWTWEAVGQGKGLHRQKKEAAQDRWLYELKSENTFSANWLILIAVLDSIWPDCPTNNVTSCCSIPWKVEAVGTIEVREERSFRILKCNVFLFCFGGRGGNFWYLSAFD